MGEAFDNYIREQSEDCDVLCFQEVSPEFFEKLSLMIKSHHGYHEEGWDLNSNEVWYGQAAFIKKNIPVASTKRVNTFGSGKETGFFQKIDLFVGDKKLVIANVHGVSDPGDKLDTPERILQSETIIKNLSQENLPIVIGGDFNLFPETKSIKMFEESGYRDLIKEFEIKTTRGKHNTEKYPEEERQYFADYVFTSSGVNIKGFEVPGVEVSDHLPMILEFTI